LAYKTYLVQKFVRFPEEGSISNLAYMVRVKPGRITPLYVNNSLGFWNN